MKREPGFWDLWFLGLAKYVSTASKDPSTKCGAVIVRPDRTVLSTGYNGFARTMPDDDALYANRDEKYSRIVHCEINAQIHAYQPIAGCTLYTYPAACCDRCVVQMVQCGVSRFVYPTPTADMLSRWKASLERTQRYLREAGVSYTEISME